MDPTPRGAMKKTLLIASCLFLAGCTGAFLPIDAPNWEKGQTYLWDVNAEASGSASFQEPGGPPITTAIPPTDLLDGSIRLTVLDVLNQTFKWYPVALESALTYMPGEFDETDDFTDYFALRASDLAQATFYTQKDPFSLQPGPFYGGFEFPVTPETRVTEDLIPEAPGLATFVLEAGSTQSIKTPAGTFEASSLEWHIVVDEAQLRELLEEEEEFSSFDFSFDASGALWFSAETQFLVQSKAKVTGSFSATLEAPDGTYRASGSGTAHFSMDLAEHGIVAVPSLSELFANGETPRPLPSIPIGEQPTDPTPTTLVLSNDRVNAATDDAFVVVDANGFAPSGVVFYLFDLNGGLLSSSNVASEWQLPTDQLGGFIVVADVLGNEYMDPAPALFMVEYDGAVANQCDDVTLPVDDCTGVAMELSHGIGTLEVRGSNAGIHTLTASNGDVSDSSTLVRSTVLSFDDPPSGMWEIEGEGVLGTAVDVTVKATISDVVSNSNPAAWTQPILPQQTLAPESALSLDSLMQWLPAPVRQSEALQSIGNALLHPVADGMLPGNH